MDTLQIDSELLRRAERQAREQNINLNQMVESYIRRFIQKTDDEKTSESVKITPFIERLGIELDLPTDFDEKDAYRKYLDKKYQ